MAEKFSTSRSVRFATGNPWQLSALTHGSTLRAPVPVQKDRTRDKSGDMRRGLSPLLIVWRTTPMRVHSMRRLSPCQHQQAAYTKTHVKTEHEAYKQKRHGRQTPPRPR